MAERQENYAIKVVQQQKKLVIVGDGYCGKTCLMTVISQGEFPTQYIPTIFENYVVDVQTENDEKWVKLQLWDTAGQEDYDRLRPLNYPDTDIVVICYSIDSRESLESITTKWYPEIEQYCPHIPCIIVGNKVDLRDENNNHKNNKYVSTEEGQKIADKIEAFGFFECSAKNQLGLSEFLQAAAVASLQPKKRLGSGYGENKFPINCYKIKSCCNIM